jgi:hypothetical protein
MNKIGATFPFYPCHCSFTNVHFEVTLLSISCIYVVLVHYYVLRSAQVGKGDSTGESRTVVSDIDS